MFVCCTFVSPKNLKHSNYKVCWLRLAFGRFRLQAVVVRITVRRFCRVTNCTTFPAFCLRHQSMILLMETSFCDCNISRCNVYCLLMPLVAHVCCIRASSRAVFLWQFAFRSLVVAGAPQQPLALRLQCSHPSVDDAWYVLMPWLPHLCSLFFFLLMPVVSVSVSM